MNKNAVIAIIVALFVPLVSYLIGKKYSYDAVVMPRHYIYDSTILKTVKGKQVEDTIWHKVKDLTLVNQLGKTVTLNSLEGKILVIDFFFTRCPSICPDMAKSMRYSKSFSSAGTMGV